MVKDIHEREMRGAALKCFAWRKRIVSITRVLILSMLCRLAVPSGNL